MQGKLWYDVERISVLTDITPTLYYLLGHGPMVADRLFGKTVFARSEKELAAFAHGDLLLASDERAVYGILTADGRYLYTTYDSPACSFLFDLASDPKVERSILTHELKIRYDQQVLDSLKEIADFLRLQAGNSFTAGRHVIHRRQGALKSVGQVSPARIQRTEAFVTEGLKMQLSKFKTVCLRP